MATHVFNSGAGIGAQAAEAGGVSGGGGTAPAGTVTIEEIQSETGSSEQGIQASQVGFANAPSTASASSRVSLIWKRVGTTQCQLKVEDDSSASGEAGTSDITASTRPVAVRPPLLNNFEDATGDYSAYQHNSSTYYYREQNYTDGEGFVDTYYAAEWNNAGLGTGGSAFVTGPLATGDTFAGSDGNTYKLGNSQGTSGTYPNDSEDWAIAQLEAPSEEHYRFTTTNTCIKLKMDYEIDTVQDASGATVPLRNLQGSQMSSGSNSSGWITTNLSTGITLNIQQIIFPAISDDTKTHITDGVVKLYAGDSTNEGLLKQFRLRVYTYAVSTY